MTRIGIFGTSGLAREVGDIADALGLQPIYVARDADEAALWTGDEPVVLEADIAHYAELSFVIGIGNGAVRRRLAESFATLRFGNLIHPSASFGKGLVPPLLREVLLDVRGQDEDVLVDVGAAEVGGVDRPSDGLDAGHVRLLGGG